MRLARSARNDAHLYFGPVHRVLRGGVEQSAWSTADEADAELSRVLAHAYNAERARLPTNARSNLALDVKARAVVFRAGDVELWRIEFQTDTVAGPRSCASAESSPED